MRLLRKNLVDGSRASADAKCRRKLTSDLLVAQNRGQGLRMAKFYNYISRQRFTDSDDSGVNESFHVKARHVGKRNTRYHPYLIANEWIAAEIAWFLRLPVAPHSLMQKKDSRTRMFVGLNFEADTVPTDADPAILWEVHPWLCSGIIVFDVLVANPDRHTGNIKVDRQAKPRRVDIFDHEQSLLSFMRSRGARRLSSFWDEFGAENHCLVDVADSAKDFGHWVDRVREIPRWFINDVCKEVRGVGVSKRDCERVRAFVEHRSECLEAIIMKHQGMFRNVRNWGVLL